MTLRSRLLVFLVLIAPAIFAQQTRTEVTRHTTPEEDARLNSDSVPDVFAIPTQFERVLILRFKHQTDLLAGLEQMVAEHKIHNAVILSAAGSVRSYHVHSVSNRTFPSKNVFIKDPTAPADLVSMNGYIIGGTVHAHVTLTDEEHAFGGHLEPGTNVFTFAAVTVGVLGDDLDLSRLADKTFR